MVLQFFGEKRVIDFKIPPSSKHEKVFAQLGPHFGVSCNAVACNLDDCCSATIRTVTLQSQLRKFGTGLDLCAKIGMFSCMERQISQEKPQE